MMKVCDGRDAKRRVLKNFTLEESMNIFIMQLNNSVTKFKKLGGKSSVTDEIYTSSKNSKLYRHILFIHFYLWPHP